MDLGSTLKRLRRAEFIGDGLGVYVGPHEVGLVHLRKGFLRIVVRDTLVVPLPGADHPAERRHALADALIGFVRTRKLGSAPTVLALHRSQALFNRLVLPAAAAENLRDVVEYEMERIIPLPKNELYYDFTMRPFGADRIEVLVMCVPQAAVREYLDTLEDALIRPQGVVVSSAAIADFFCFCRDDAAGPVAFLLQSDGDVELTLLTDRRLVSSVLLPKGRTREDSDFARLVARELTDELVGLSDVALYSWSTTNGSGPVQPLLGADELLPLARDHLDASEEFFSDPEPAVLPAVGAALGAVRESTVAVNFLQGELAETGGARWLLSAVLVFVLVLASLAWGVSIVARDAMRRGELEAELARLRPQLTGVKAMEEEAAALRQSIETITEGRNEHAVEFLREVTALLPDDSYLTTFRLRGSQIQLDGFARAASELIPQLEESEHFKNVKFSSPVTKAQGRDRFSIALELE